jgi:hypothetical protein
MKTMTNALSITVIIGLILVLGGFAQAKDEAGSVVALKGRAAIERQKKSLDAKIKDTIFMNDIITTFDASRVKMLFLDDSVLTLGEKSKVSVKEFVQGKGKGDKSIFNLIDGKMRSVVGRAGFEIHTPTAVAAARGTIILTETGVMNGKKFSTFIAYEGEFCVESIDPKIPGKACLKPGMMITLIEGEPVGETVRPSDAQIFQLLMNTDTTGSEISMPATGTEISKPAPLLKFGSQDFDGWSTFIDMPPDLPPIDLGSINAATPVNINITFP